MNSKLSIFAALLLACVVVSQNASAQDLRIYSTRKQAQLQPLLDKFQKENPGVTFSYAKGKNWDLISDLEKEGKQTPGDIYLTKDLVYLNEAAEKGLLIPFDSAEVRKNIPAYLIDNGKMWVGLALRARTMVYNPSLVQASELSTYEDLATPAWEARMCLRTSLSCYSVGFTASLIHHLGAEKTVDVLKGWVNNTAIDPTIGDELLLESIDSGICGVGVINTHYLAQVLKEKPNLNAKVFFANQNTTGAHMNGSGVGILKTTKNKELALKFIEFLTRADVQTEFAAQQMEYPANAAAQTPALLKSFGDFKGDTTSWSELGKYLKKSRELFIEADYK
jgi:iron(III) transport system substrate-binding protein